MSEEAKPVMDRQDVAAFLGVTPKLISQFLTESKEGHRYERNPFPEPNGRIGSGPWWKLERKPEFLAWMAARPGRGVGGGRPSHRTN